MRKVKYGYMCCIAYNCELENTKVEVYHSIEALKKEHPFIDDPNEECSIVKVKIEECSE